MIGRWPQAEMVREGDVRFTGRMGQKADTHMLYFTRLGDFRTRSGRRPSDRVVIDGLLRHVTRFA